MNDEDALRKALKEEKVILDGKEYPVKKVDPVTIQLHDPGFKREYLGTFSNPGPIGLIHAEPATSGPELFLPKRKHRPLYQDDTRPEVALREGIRAAVRGGLSPAKIKEIFEHELVFGVMGS